MTGEGYFLCRTHALGELVVVVSGWRVACVVHASGTRDEWISSIHPDE